MVRVVSFCVLTPLGVSYCQVRSWVPDLEIWVGSYSPGMSGSEVRTYGLRRYVVFIQVSDWDPKTCREFPSVRNHRYPKTSQWFDEIGVDRIGRPGGIVTWSESPGVWRSLWQYRCRKVPKTVWGRDTDDVSKGSVLVRRFLTYLWMMKSTCLWLRTSVPSFFSPFVL